MPWVWVFFGSNFRGPGRAWYFYVVSREPGQELQDILSMTIELTERSCGKVNGMSKIYVLVKLFPERPIPF